MVISADPLRYMRLKHQENHQLTLDLTYYLKANICAYSLLTPAPHPDLCSFNVAPAVCRAIVLDTHIDWQTHTFFEIISSHHLPWIRAGTFYFEQFALKRLGGCHFTINRYHVPCPNIIRIIFVQFLPKLLVQRSTISTKDKPGFFRQLS